MVVNTYHINHIYCIDGENPKADCYFNRPACQSINQSINKKNALYLSVNVFSTKVLIGTLFFCLLLWTGPGIEPATSRSAVKRSTD